MENNKTIIYWGRCEGKPDSFYDMYESGTIQHKKTIAKSLNEYIDLCLEKIPEGFEILCKETKNNYICRFRKRTNKGISEVLENGK